MSVESMLSNEKIITQLSLKVDELNRDLHKVKRANSKLKDEVRRLEKEKNEKLKKERKLKKPHFKNGKRGTFKNG